MKLGSWQVREINQPGQLSAYRNAWNALVDQAAQPNFLLTLDWLVTYWQHCGASQHLRILLIENHGDLAGIVPCCVSRERTRIGHVRLLGFPLENWGTFYEPLGTETSEFLQAALQHLSRTPRDWDVIDLRWLPEQHIASVEEAFRHSHLAFTRTVWATAALVELTGGWESYWQSRTSKWRNNVRRCRRRLESQGEVRFERYRPAAGEQPDWQLYETCERIAAQSWQGQAADGTTLSNQRVRQFLRAAHAVAVSNGAAEINLLHLGDRPAAFAYNYVHRGCVTGLRGGYDAEVSREGAGTVLLQQMLQDSFRRGDCRFDLGADYLTNKRAWQTSLVPTYRVCSYAPRPRARSCGCNGKLSGYGCQSLRPTAAANLGKRAIAMMPRFVLLRHETPPGYLRPSHWDLMLETGETLATWALDQLPVPGCKLPLEELPNHRLQYLDYEGPVSGERGRVTRCDAGRFWVRDDTGQRMDIVFSGKLLRGIAILEQIAEKQWLLTYEGWPEKRQSPNP